MVGKGKDTARDPPNPTPAFNVDMLQQMIAALQLVVDRDEDRRLWDAVGPPPPEPTIRITKIWGGADNQVQPGASMQQGTLPTSSQPACDPAAVAQSAPVLARSASPSPTPHAQRPHARGGPYVRPTSPVSAASYDRSGVNDHGHRYDDDMDDGHGECSGHYGRGGRGGCGSGGGPSGHGGHGHGGHDGHGHGGHGGHGGDSGPGGCGGQGGCGRCGGHGGHDGQGTRDPEGSGLGARYYAVTRGRAVGVFVGWCVGFPYSAVVVYSSVDRRHNVTPLVTRVPDSAQVRYPTFAAALAAFLDSAALGNVRIILP
ncbi:hypothetical protein EVJ58_g6970 [Rhodofomes roseus]|uniref:Uncharacterized protein n=1 Tax=Rhodofomes roseus TaxID=34475 RepID=A0A4Y9Y6W3_9APHY|nr:hypothetical protein EVJ58_g6970 [Rhodofomes roseus]